MEEFCFGDDGRLNRVLGLGTAEMRPLCIFQMIWNRGFRFVSAGALPSGFESLLSNAVVVSLNLKNASDGDG